jgi:hypothetical protein
LTQLDDGAGAAPVSEVKVRKSITHIRPRPIYSFNSYRFPVESDRVIELLEFENSAGVGIETFPTVGGASRVLNIVSVGATSDELYLTFTFEWDHREIQAGSEKAFAKQNVYQSTALKGVDRTLAQIRKLASEGKL